MSYLKIIYLKIIYLKISKNKYKKIYDLIDWLILMINW